MGAHRHRGAADRDEEAELARALAQDPRLRGDFLDDQRLEAALLAWGAGPGGRRRQLRPAVRRAGGGGARRRPRSSRRSIAGCAPRRWRGALGGPRALRWLPLVLVPAALAAAVWCAVARAAARAHRRRGSPRTGEPPERVPAGATGAGPRPPARPAPAAQLAEVSGVAFVLLDAQRVPAAAGARAAARGGLDHRGHAAATPR